MFCTPVPRCFAAVERNDDVLVLGDRRTPAETSSTPVADAAAPPRDRQYGFPRLSPTHRGPGVNHSCPLLSLKGKLCAAQLGQMIQVARLACVLDLWSRRHHPRRVGEVEELRHIHLRRISC